MGLDLDKLPRKSGVDWVRIKAAKFLGYAEAGNTSQVSNKHVLGISINEFT